MKRQPQAEVPWAEKIRQLKRDLGLSQAKMAAAVGVSQSTVSDWEKGEYPPSADKYAALGNLAIEKDPKLALWFYERFGINFKVVRKLVPAIDEEFRRFEKRIKGIAEYSYPVPVFRTLENVGKGTPLPVKDAESVLPIPKLLIPNPGSTVLLRAPDANMWPIFGKGDLVAVDLSFVGQLADTIVLAHHSRDEGNWNAGIHFGWLRYIWNRDRQIGLLEQLKGRTRLEQWARESGFERDWSQADRDDAPPADTLPDVLGNRTWKVIGRVVFWIGSYVPIKLRDENSDLHPQTFPNAGVAKKS